MSKVFYDHLILFEELWVEIEALPLSSDEKRKMKVVSEEMIHYKIFTLILDLLPKVHHEEFLSRFHSAPHDGAHLKFLQEKVSVAIHHEISAEAEKIKKEVKRELKKHSKRTYYAHKR